MHELANMKRGERAYVVCTETDDETEVHGFIAARNLGQALRRFGKLNTGGLPSGAFAVAYSRASEETLAEAREAEAMAYGDGG